MLLQILITHYKEKQELVEELLNSIASQKRIDGKDVAITIINDGDEVVLDTTDFYKYPYKIKYLIEDHSGVSKARQIAFDKTKSDYVMGFDCDDVFYSDYDLFVIVQKLKTYPTIDIFEGITVMEVGEDLSYQHSQNGVHAHIFKRDFLIKENLKGNFKLKTHEDGYFSRLCRCCTKNVCSIEVPIYLFRDIKGSVTRDMDYDAIGVPWERLTYDDKMFAATELIEELLARHKSAEAGNYAFVQSFVPFIYLIVGTGNNDYCRERGIKEKMIKLIKEFGTKYKPLIDLVSEESRNTMSDIIRVQTGLGEVSLGLLMTKFYEFTGEK